MGARGYLTDDLPPEHVHQGAQIRALLNRVIALEKRMDDLAAENARLKKKVSYLEGAHTV